MQPERFSSDKRFRSDNVFNLINKHFITLKDEDMKAYAVHLKRVLDTFVLRMKTIDPLFNACFRKIAYVGSYYEGLKVGMPEEFDLNIIINLPINYNNDLTFIISPEKPGFIKIKATSELLSTLQNHVRWTEYKSMEKWFTTINGNLYLDQNKFRQWFESVVIRTFHSFPTKNGNYVLTAGNQEYSLRHKKSGPAFTLKIGLPDWNIIDVDLVPALEFDNAPPPPFRSHTKEKKWFAISKPLSETTNDNVLWRPSFYVREQEILKGSLKPVIRQMKKLRDTQNFKSIASYYIKVLFLRELEDQNFNIEFQRMNPTFLFFHMLQKLQQACEKHEIIDLWNPKNNLLSGISRPEMLNHSYRLARIIKDINKEIGTDPYCIAKHILNKEELERLKDVHLSSGMAAVSLDESRPSPSPTYSGFWNFWQ